MTKKLILATAVLCAGCGVEPITEGEAVGVLAELMRLLDEVPSLNEGDTESVSCPSGGSATVELLSTVEDFEGDTVEFESVWSIRPAACAVTSAGTPFTVDGDPDLQVHWEIWAVSPFDDDDYNFEYRLDGGFIWDRDSEGGSRCEVSLVSEDAVLNPYGSLDGAVTGSLCGMDVTFGLHRLFPQDEPEVR